MTLKFSSKASTLAILQQSINTAKIAPLLYFTIDEWKQNQTNFLETTMDSLGPPPWIVRSSSQAEDSFTQSNAGAFLSILNVDNDSLESAIEQVISSYETKRGHDEVLIQPMLSNVVCSGVAFSHDPNTGSPYRIVNWHEGSDTTFITSGLGGKTWQQAALPPQDIKEKAPKLVSQVITLVEELLVLFGGLAIDCEFAFTKESNSKELLWLLQARPLVLSKIPETEFAQQARLQRVHDKIEKAMPEQPFLRGSKTAYGIMPDWNPAEIIGIRPKALARSLYGELITDSIWAYQRHNYGYRNLRSFPLMPNFCGLPYIDLRVSFNSFIPAEIDNSFASRLVDHYIQQLAIYPEHHDKVEFEIVYSCYTLDLPQRLKQLSDFGFSSSEIDQLTASLRTLTNNIIHPTEGLWQKDAAKLDKLLSRRETLLSSNAGSIERIYWLIEDTKRYGTLPFAGLARAGFIAIQMLKSLVSVDILSQDDYDSFLTSISTVSSQLTFDRANLDKTTFLSRYGHLRPGTYDILSPRYDEQPDLYFDWAKRPTTPKLAKPFSLTLTQMRKLKELLNSHGLNADPVGLFDFLQAGIELRELAKFHFTKNLSDVLSLIADLGAQHGISRQDMAYCDISIFKELYISSADPKQTILHSIEQGKSHHKEATYLSLPPLITSPEDAWSFEWPQTSPNFITQKQVTAPVVNSDDKNAISGAVVCIPNADPGFDWLFSYPIAGLITAWGGVNSHMAIRAGELGLPAVIGSGEALYKQWSQAQRLHVDCAGRRVEILA